MRPFAPDRPIPPQFVGRGGGHDAELYLAIVLHFLAVALVVAAAVYIALRVLRHRAEGRRPGRSPGLDELDVRYARGEIDRAEYVTRRADLLGITYGPPPAYPQGGAPPTA